MTNSGNTNFKYPVVLALATLLFIPLIRTSEIQFKQSPDSRKLQDFVKQVSQQYNQDASLPSISLNNSISLDSIAWPVNQSMSSEQVLSLLIPGRTIVDPVTDDTLNGWTCSDCKPQWLLDPISEWFDTSYYISFPFAKNYTRIVGDYSMKAKDSIQQRLIAFSTSDQEFAAGRFSGGVLGLVLIELKNQQWGIKAFNPSLMYQGSFGSAQGISAILENSSFGNLLIINAVSMEDAALDDCNSVVEDRYIVDAQTLQLVLRIPSAEKVCKWENKTEIPMDFPNWTTQMKLVNRGTNEIELVLEVQGMYMTASDLNSKRLSMGLLPDLPDMLKKQHPDKFVIAEQEPMNSSIDKHSKVTQLGKRDSLSMEEKVGNTSSLVPFFIPYKAQLQTTLKRNTINGIPAEIKMLPWKIDWLLN